MHTNKGSDKKSMPGKGTQAHRILSHLLRWGKLGLPLILDWRIASYTKEITRLRRMGWNVTCEQSFKKRGKETVRIVEYVLGN